MEPQIDLHLLFSQLDTDTTDGSPRQLRLYHLIRSAILNGTLIKDARLPATRVLAADLGIARNSVLYAYERLTAEGFLGTGRHGTQVLLAPRNATKPPGTVPKPLPSGRSQQLARFRGFGSSEERAFAPGSPDCDAFPRKQWLSCLNAAWQRAGPAQLRYGAAAGEPALRSAISNYLRAARGVRCTPEQVLVTAGSQAGLDACARVLADTGCTAWVENPGYLGVRATFAMAGHVVRPIPVDAEGMAPLESDWQQHRPKLIHVTPSQQFPLGVMLSLPRRLDMIRRAAAVGAWIIEDDYDSEFRYAGRPLAAMQGLVEDAPVIYVGTFSRMMFPALRIGYLVLPPGLTAIASGMAELTWPGHAIEQEALADFISRGNLIAHVRRMKRLYGERRTELIRSLERHLGSSIQVVGSAGGLQLTVLLDPALGVSDLRVSDAAAAQGLSIRPLSIYTMPDERSSAMNGFMLGFAAVPVSDIDDAVKRLRLAIAISRAGK